MSTDTKTTTSDDDRCSLCGQTRAWHEDNAPRHQFDADASTITGDKPKNAGTESGALKLSLDDALRRVKAKSDPVVRLLLIRHGIISTDEIEATELKIARSLVENKPIVERIHDHPHPAEQDLRPHGRDSTSHLGDRDGGEPVRGVRSDSAQSGGGSTILGEEDAQPSGQSVQQLQVGPSDHHPVGGGSWLRRSGLG